MTLLAAPVTAPAAPSLAGALDAVGPLGWLLLVSTADPLPAERALRRESRAGDWVGSVDGDTAVVVVALPADLDAVADRLLSVAEHATGRPAAAGVCRVDPALPADELLRRARLGLSVAWSCGGGRVVRHP